MTELEEETNCSYLWVQGFRAKAGQVVELLPTIPEVLPWRKALMDGQGWQKMLEEAAMKKCLNSHRFRGHGLVVEKTGRWNYLPESL